MSDKGQEIG